MKFAVGCVYYNDVKSLERQLESTQFFDHRIMIDGRFKFHNGEPFSTDGSKELVESYPNVISLSLYDTTEAEKRNLYLKTCGLLNVDWLLILDSDEYITCDESLFKRDLAAKFDLEHNHYIYAIMSRRYPADYVKYDERPRLWYDPVGFEYTTCHCCYQRKDGKERTSERPIIDGIKIEHDKSLRTKQHETDWYKFIHEYQLIVESQLGVSL